MASSKEIKRRIRSVTNTKQIISAMEMVSVVKMQKSVARNLASRDFSAASAEMLAEICKGINPESHPLLKQKVGVRKLVVVITSDRGLCGALNLRALKLALAEVESGETDFIAIGKKSRDFLGNHGFNIVASYTGFGDYLEFKVIIPIIRQITNEYLADRYNQVNVVYTHFESGLTQTPKALQLLPFLIDFGCTADDNLTFEPSKAEILSSLIPRILETNMWQYILESAASEHSARMVAMKNADENAEDLITDLTLSFNQTRQAGITREIAEISAGKMTLEAN